MKFAAAILKSKVVETADVAPSIDATPAQPEFLLSQESAQIRDRFKAALESHIDIKFAESMLGKKDTERFLTYVDGQIITAHVRNVFRTAIGVTPPQIEAACSVSEAILAPSAVERQRLIKVVVGAGGVAVGLAMIIKGLALALDWGLGPTDAVSAWIASTSFAGPAAWAIPGITLAGVAAYFAATSDDQVRTERFLGALKMSTSSAVDAMWPEHEQSLTAALSRDPTAK